MPTTTYRFLNSFFGGGIVFLCEGTGLMAVSDMTIKQTEFKSQNKQEKHLV
jgi:hypothetical protein